MNPSGREVVDGFRTFVVGTGGKSLAGFKKTMPGSEFRDDDHFGVLRLSLEDGRYNWRFVTEGGRTLDSGTGTCR